MTDLLYITRNRADMNDTEKLKNNPKIIKALYLYAYLYRNQGDYENIVSDMIKGSKKYEAENNYSEMFEVDRKIYEVRSKNSEIVRSNLTSWLEEVIEKYKKYKLYHEQIYFMEKKYRESMDHESNSPFDMLCFVNELLDESKKIEKHDVSNLFVYMRTTFLEKSLMSDLMFFPKATRASRSSSKRPLQKCPSSLRKKNSRTATSTVLPR